MGRVCMITNKKVMTGNNVSHANNKSKRTFLPNVQDTSVYSEALGRKIRLSVTTAGLRTLDHNGGLDAWLASTAKTKLHPKLRPVKEQVEAALAQKQAS